MQVKKCGDCAHWMKSRVCPKEKLQPNGFHIGPSELNLACPLFTTISDIASAALDAEETKVKCNAVGYCDRCNRRGDEISQDW